MGDPHARILILGSMPGEASLRAQEYYAHPRNAFWPIMGQLFEFDPGLPYPERVRYLITARVAVWDVLATCHREGSLDAEIDDASSTVNDFAVFLRDIRSFDRSFLTGPKQRVVF